MDNIFKKQPPINGGTFFNDKIYIENQENIIKQRFAQKTINTNVKDLLKSENFTYNLWFLLQQQADYFTSIVQFKFNNKNVNESLYKAIRCTVIYGKSAIWFTTNGLIPLYINKIEYDSLTGNPVYMSAALVDNIFAQKTLDPVDVKWVEFNKGEFENVYILNVNSYGLGGVVRWQPFLRQFENLLKMLYTHAYSYIKFILYDIKDTSAIKNELELFFNSESPFLINLGDDNLIRNKFKEFNFTNTDKNAFFEYIDRFLQIYYNLIGRRYNVDFKKERNITNEVNASQDNFDILQNELKVNILCMLDWVATKTGMNYETTKEFKESEINNDI